MRHSALATAAAVAVFVAPIAHAQLMEPVLIGTAAGRPTSIGAPPGVSDRIYVADKNGRIFVHRNGALVQTPFLDIRPIVDQEGENGLLGVAFDPDFASTGTFYVSYTLEGTAAGDSVVSRFHTVPGSLDVADPGTEEILFGPYPQTTRGHKGGDIEIGTDGMLYVALGDGDAGSAAGLGTAQDIADPRGKILRLDPSLPYPHVPADNPLLANPGADPLIWALGFRNPYRLDVDPLTGDVYVADVGSSRWEEITRLPSGTGGLNGGWPCMEGDDCLSHAACVCPSPALLAPVAARPHSGAEGYCAVIGGIVYRGTDIPGLFGQYLYTDFCSGKVHGVIDPAGAALDVDHSVQFLDPNTGLPIRFIGDIGRDGDGELYIAEHYSARIWKLIPRAGVETYCESTPNSGGTPALLDVTGSTSLGAENLILTVTALPKNRLGFFLMSRVRLVTPNFAGSAGTLCLGLPIVRWDYVVLDSGPTGGVTTALDFSGLPFGAAFAPGETWHFQYWTRDADPLPTSNTSSAVAVTFGL